MRAVCWWVDRWRKSTAYICMDMEQQGLYRNLLDAVWLFDGRPIPNEEKALVSASGGDAKAWKRSGATVLRWMRLVDGGWVNDTATDVMRGTTSQSVKGRKRADSAPRIGGKFTIRAPAGAPAGAPAASGLSQPAQHQPPDPDPDPYKNKYKERCVEISPNEETLAMRAGRLVERYAELFYQHRQGARYHSRIHLDFQKAQQLVKTWPDDARLEKLAVIVLKSDDEWISGTDRGFGVFAAKATWADDRLAEWEAAHPETGSNHG